MVTQPVTARYLIGDAIARMRELPDASVHCAVTSPPYYRQRDYKIQGQLGLEASVEQYVSNLVAVCEEVWRVLRPDGTFWLNLGDSYTVGSKKGLKAKDLLGVPWRVAFALQGLGWYVRSDIVWAKPNPMPGSIEDRPISSHEYIFLLTKSPRYYYDAHAVRQGEPEPTHHLRDVWTIATESFKGAHFAVFPRKLVRPCIQAGTSAHGACPACGAPWRRLLDKRRVATRPGTSGKFHAVRCACNKQDAVGRSHYTGFNARWAAGHRDPGRHVTASRTIGWQPTCACYDAAYRAMPEAASPRKRWQRTVSGDHWRRTRARPGGADWSVVPCLVLDPFVGSGTTLVVAEALGRSSIGIDLQGDYEPLWHARRQKEGLEASAGQAVLYDESVKESAQ